MFYLSVSVVCTHIPALFAMAKCISLITKLVPCQITKNDLAPTITKFAYVEPFTTWREFRERFSRHRGLLIPTWCMPGSLTSGFVWSRWWGKRSRHPWRMHNPQFYVSGKRSIKRTGLFFTVQQLRQCQSMTTYSHVVYSSGDTCACVFLGLLQTGLTYITEILGGNLSIKEHSLI